MTIRFSALAALAVFAAPLASAQTIYQQPAGFANASGISVANDSQGWIYSENFIEANDGSDGYLADDFTVPAGQEWTIENVAVLAFYADENTFDGDDTNNNTIVKATSFNVIVWSDDADADTPGDTRLLDLQDVTPTSDNTGQGGVTGIITFDLPTAVDLGPGRYWLTVQANMPTENLGSGTRYFWGSNDATFGENVQWWNYGGGLASAAPCDMGWGDNTPECGDRNRNDNDPTVYMRIEGQVSTASEEIAQGLTVSLLPARPNPAVGETRIPFTLRAPADVRLAVYDALGREVAVVAERAYGAGEQAETLDTSALAPGTYVVRLTAGADVVLRTLSVAR